MYPVIVTNVCMYMYMCGKVQFDRLMWNKQRGNKTRQIEGEKGRRERKAEERERGERERREREGERGEREGGEGEERES